MSTYPLLSLAIWIPILAGAVVLATGGDRNAPLARILALFGALAGFLVTIPLWTGFDVTNGGMQFVELKGWIIRFNVNYHLGVDGISMLFVVLNAFITIIVVAAGWEVIREKVAQYNAAFLIMSGLMNGIFTSLDGVLFYVFFEASLIPLYLIIGVWGGPNRVYAAFKFFLYTLFGSLLFLLALIYLFVQSGWQLLDPRLAQDADPARRRRSGCSSPSWSPSRSRCRCGRCIPGCRTPTSRRRPAARSCWRRSR